ADPDDALAKSPASVLMIVASALIFAVRFLFTGWPLATATICRMSISAGAAAARMESRVDTQAVEHAVQNMARDTETTRTFLIMSSPLIFQSLSYLLGVDTGIRRRQPMRHDDGQRRKDRRRSGMVHPERSNRRRGGVRERSKQEHNSGQISSVLLQNGISLVIALHLVLCGSAAKSVKPRCRTHTPPMANASLGLPGGIAIPLAPGQRGPIRTRE